MIDELIEEIDVETTQSDIDNSDESVEESVDESVDVSSVDSVSEDIAYDDFVFEDVSEVVVDDLCNEDYNILTDDYISVSESDQSPVIDYSVSLDNISLKLDNIVTSISDNKVECVYDYNYNVVSILLLSAVVGVMLFSLFTRRF